MRKLPVGARDLVLAGGQRGGVYEDHEHTDVAPRVALRVVVGGELPLVVVRGQGSGHLRIETCGAVAVVIYA
jgi:hypothetical protein